MQVSEQVRRNCILVKILDQSELVAVSTKNFRNFFLERILPSLLGPENILSECFGAKMPTLYSGQNFWPVEQKGIFLETLPVFFFFFDLATLHSSQNSWPVGTSGIFVQNLQDFFFIWKNFPFYSWTTKYAICMFWSKNANIVFGSKFFTCRTKGHFLTNFDLIFFIFFNRTFHVFLRS